MACPPSTQTTRYDRARVARLRPITAAVDQLGLPPIRRRKLNGILNAFTMQVEDGGDSPTVNALLVEALRAGIVHQVGTDAAQPVLAAIDAFEQIEAERWVQARAGTLPPIELTPAERLLELIDEGNRLVKQRQTAAGCDRWLVAWELVKQLATPAIRSTRSFDDAHGLGVAVSNWCHDLEMELGHTGFSDPRYHQHRLRFTQEFLAQFPDEDANVTITMTSAQAEALWWLGRMAEAETVYVALIARYPDAATPYIHWSDLYWLYHESPKNYAKAEAILRRALAHPQVGDRQWVDERLASLSQERAKAGKSLAVSASSPAIPAPRLTPSGRSPDDRAQSTPARQRPGRNDRCWCGSGRKYKHCHLRSDEAGASGGR